MGSWRFPRGILEATCGFPGLNSKARVLVEGFEVEDVRWRH